MTTHDLHCPNKCHEHSTRHFRDVGDETHQRWVCAYCGADAIGTLTETHAGTNKRPWHPKVKP